METGHVAGLPHRGAEETRASRNKWPTVVGACGIEILVGLISADRRTSRAPCRGEGEPGADERDHRPQCTSAYQRPAVLRSPYWPAGLWGLDHHARDADGLLAEMSRRPSEATAGRCQGIREVNDPTNESSGPGQWRAPTARIYPSGYSGVVHPYMLGSSGPCGCLRFRASFMFLTSVSKL